MMESMRNLHIVLFIAVMCVVQTMALVGPNNDTAGNKTSISKTDLPPCLTSISLEDNPLTKFYGDAFDASVATLERAYFSNVKLHKLPKALKYLKRLKDLEVRDTPIQIWHYAILNNIAATVDRLVLNNVSLSSWPRWISYFPLLKRLDLSWNSLKSIPDNAFRVIKNELTSLLLSGTGLTHVPKALSTLSNLYSLFLNNNSFTDASELMTITQSQFASKLSSLTVNSAGLDRIVNFSNLTNLTILDLIDNKITDVPAGSLPRSTNMLKLSDNLLSSVPKGLAVMSKLELLNLKNNRISVLRPNSFPLRLTHLDLNSNKLTAISDTTFKNLRFLKMLELGLNPISTISPSAFSDLISLSTLSINSPRLTEIPLALTALKPNIRIFLTMSQPTSCNCPAPQKLVKWFTQLKSTWSVHVNCSNGQSVQTYLSDKCETKLSPP